MSSQLRTSLFFLVVLSFLIFIAGCGGGAQITTPAKIGFTNSNLNGTYSFSVTGTNGGGFFTFAGSFQANGSGAITSGTIDINSPGTLASPINTSLSGTYNVLSDGRTQATLNTSAGSFIIDFVLLSSSNALVIRFDNNATASGSVDLQNSGAFSNAALAGTFAFNLSGIDNGGFTDTTAGAFTFNSAGTVTTGVQDVNDNGAITANGAAITSGTVVSPTNGRGNITLTTAIGTLDFAFYVIDANHIRLISTDTLPVFSGDAFRQPSSFTLSSTLPAGSFAFTLAGSNPSGSGAFPFVAGGVLTSDGNGNITGVSTEDINVAGTLTQNLTVPGTYTIAANGRGTMTLSTANESLAIYPTMTGGVLLINLNATAVADGTALQQQGGPFSNSSINGNYGLNLTGDNLNESAEIDAVAQFSASGGGSLNGAIDLNNSGSLSPSGAFNGTYSISSNGRGTGALNVPGEKNLGLSNFGMIYYVVSASRVLFIEADPAQPSVGVFATQTM